MPEKSFRPLALHALAVVCESTIRLQLLLEKHDHLLSDNDQRVANWITSRLQLIQEEVRSRCLLLAVEPTDNELLWSTFFLLLSPITDLEDSHTALKHLSIPKLLRDTTVLLRSFWNSLDTKNKYGQPPALSLSDDVEPSEHNISDDADVAVVNLAKVDYTNPTAWPLLVHELGHRLIPRLNLFGKNIDEVEKDWLIELGCDRLGARLVGPAYVAALAHRALTKYAYFVGSSIHPPPYIRLDAILSSLDRWMAETPLVKRMFGLHALRISAERKNSGGLLPTTVPAACPTCGVVKREIPRQQSPRMRAQMQRFFARLDSALQLGAFDRGGYAVSARMTSRLAQGTLVSATHKELSRSFRQLAEKRRKRSTTPQELRAAFDRFVPKLCDSPHASVEIITGAWIHSALTSDDRLQRTLLNRHVAFEKGWQTLKDEIRKFDELVLASIETAEFHRELGDVHDI